MTKRKTPAIRRRERLVLKELVSQAGMRLGMLDLHEYLIKHPGWHTSRELADEFDICVASVFRWANRLWELGYLDRIESSGIDEGEGGRIPAQFAADRKRCRTSLKAKFQREAEKVARLVELRPELK